MHSKEASPAVEKTHYLAFACTRCLTVASRLASSVEKLPDDKMHDHTPTDTENVYRATMTYFAVNFTRGESGTETYTGHRGDAMRYVLLRTFYVFFRKDKGNAGHILSEVLPCLGIYF